MLNDQSVVDKELAEVTSPTTDLVVPDARESKDQKTAYEEFLAERREILCHKWIESEKAGYDIGFERALIDWIVKHRPAWHANRKG